MRCCSIVEHGRSALPDERRIRQGEMQRCCGQDAQEKEVIFELELWDEVLPDIQGFWSTGYTFVREESVVVQYS